jgi:hypothetical protein
VVGVTLEGVPIVLENELYSRSSILCCSDLYRFVYLFQFRSELSCSSSAEVPESMTDFGTNVPNLLGIL